MGNNSILSRVFRRSGLCALFFAAAAAAPLSLGQPAQAAYIDGQQVGEDQYIRQAAENTYLGYIMTGNQAMDSTTQAGLRGLAGVLRSRTNVENLGPPFEGNASVLLPGMVPALPVGLDPARDDLSLVPFIYWAIDPDRPMPSRAAIDGLNEYTRSGGMLFIDLRSAVTGQRGQRWLQQVQDAGLDIPALATVRPCEGVARSELNADIKERCHVLGRTFYLLEEFPGRYEGGQVWAENAPVERHDGVATVIVGENDWAAAWAVDERGLPRFPTMGRNPEQREWAYRFGVNLVMYALTGSYKDDQVHAPEILQRMTPD